MSTMTKKNQTRTGSELVPKADQIAKITSESRWYWIGALPGAPTDSLDVAGVSFPKRMERVRKDPNTGATNREPKMGALARLDKSRIDLMRKRLPWMVIRFNHTVEEDQRLRDEQRRQFKTPEAQRTCDPLGGPGDSLEILEVRRRKGRPIRIWSAEEMKEAKENGINLRSYSPDPKDEPLARYIFAIPCTNQTHPSRGEYYPDSLEETGLEWPDELKE